MEVERMKLITVDIGSFNIKTSEGVNLENSLN